MRYCKYANYCKNGLSEDLAFESIILKTTADLSANATIAQPLYKLPDGDGKIIDILSIYFEGQKEFVRGFRIGDDGRSVSVVTGEAVPRNTTAYLSLILGSGQSYNKFKN